MKTGNIHLRIMPPLKAAYQKICDIESQNSSELLRKFIQEKIKNYLIEEIQLVKLTIKKAFSDNQRTKYNIQENANIEVVFKEDRILYFQDDGIKVGEDKWDDIFKNYPELFEYALDI